MQIQGQAPGGIQTPASAVTGYIHWSALIYKRRDTSGSDNIFSFDQRLGDVYLPEALITAGCSP